MDSKCRFQNFQTPLIFLRRADGNSDPFRQLIAAHRTHNHALLLHRLENALAGADANQNEIGVGRNEFELQIAERALEKFQPGEIVRPCFADMFIVVQRGKRGGLREQIDVEWLPDFLQRGDEIRIPNTVTDAQAGQPVNF